MSLETTPSAPTYECEENLYVDEVVKRDHFARQASTILVATSAVISLTLTGEQPQSIDAMCRTMPSTKFIQETEAQLEAPDAPGVANVRAKVSGAPVRQQRIELAEYSAHQNHLYLADDSGIKQLEADADNGFTKPFSEYFNTAKEYFSKYGIAVDTDKHIGKFANAASMSTNEYETNRSKNQVLETLEMARSIPKEYYEISQPNTIHFARTTAGVATWYSYNNDIVIGINNQGGGGSYGHESFHGLSQAMCLGSQSRESLSSIYDPQIAAINRHASRKEEGVINTMEDGYILEEERITDIEELRTAHTGSMSEAARQQLEADASQVYFAREYSLTSDDEDAATIGEWIDSPEANKEILMAHTPLRKKAIIWYARIRQTSPKLFNYLNTILPAIDRE